MVNYLAILALLPIYCQACVECSGFPNIHWVSISPDSITVLINGEEKTFHPIPGYWTLIDPETGQITQAPNSEPISKEKSAQLRD